MKLYFLWFLLQYIMATFKVNVEVVILNDAMWEQFPKKWLLSDDWYIDGILVAF